MATNDAMDDEGASQWFPQRRQQDRIATLDARVREVLLGGGQGGASGPLGFVEAVAFAVSNVATHLGEELLEVWLRDMPPWGSGAHQGLRPIAGATKLGARPRAANAEPDDVLLAIVTASRPLRHDDPHHQLFQRWAASAGIFTEHLTTYLGLPIRYRGTILGVLAVAMSEPPTAEHVLALDALVDYIAASAHDANLRHLLQSQRELAQTVLQHAPIAAAVVTPGDHIIVLTNGRFDTLLRIGPDVWGQRLDAALPDHARQLRHAFQLDEVARSGEPRVIVDLSIRLTEGLTYWDFTSSPLRTTTGAIEGILIAGVDVTARVVQRQRQKRSVDIAQERVAQMVALHQISLDVATQLEHDPFDLLRQIVEKMATLVEATGGIVFYADRESGAMEAVVSTGLRRDYTGIHIERDDGLAGHVVTTGQGQWVEDFRRSVFRSAALTDEPFGAVAAIPLKQRGRVLGVIYLIHEISAQPSQAAVVEIASAFTAEDIWMLELFANQAAQVIETARTYQDLERAYQRQRTLDRLKDDFLARASHDLRLPLTSIVGFLDLALEGETPPKDLMPLVRQAATEAQRLQAMLEDLLAQSWLENADRATQPRPVALGAVIEEVVEARRQQVALHGGPHQFTVAAPPHIIVLADLIRLKEVLENVISNAVKYSPRGGAIAITAEPQTDGFVITRISDEGIGIPADERERIFERFTRLESPLASEIRGSGVGLYLARQLVESMRGRIWLESGAPGVGSTFAISLPLTRP